MAPLGVNYRRGADWTLSVSASSPQRVRTAIAVLGKPPSFTVGRISHLGYRLVASLLPTSARHRRRDVACACDALLGPGGPVIRCARVVDSALMVAAEHPSTPMTPSDREDVTGADLTVECHSLPPSRPGVGRLPRGTTGRKAAVFSKGSPGNLTDALTNSDRWLKTAGRHQTGNSSRAYPAQRWPPRLKPRALSVAAHLRLGSVGSRIDPAVGVGRAESSVGTLLRSRLRR
jgi:hypothetical protein